MMTEKDVRKKRKAEQMRKKKQRRRVTIATVILIAILLGVLAFLFWRNQKEESGKNPNDTGMVSEDSSAEQEGTDSAGENGTGQGLPEATPSPDEPERIELGEALKYTGNLILVNSDYAYDFEDNAYDLMLQDVASYGDVPIPVGEEGIQLAYRIMEPLSQMIRDCNQALNCNDTGVTSAWRSLEEQRQIYADYAEQYGQDYAEAYVADPGYSEHHTGLALDMGIYYPSGGIDSFSQSDNAVWMNDNCYRYGFIRRYKEDKVNITGINNESWHFRYVGIPHATYMYQQNLCLEEYIGYLRTQTSVNNPLTVECENGTYEIYSTRESSIPEPTGEYTVEGDNIDGYIVTSLVSAN